MTATRLCGSILTPLLRPACVSSSSAWNNLQRE